MKKVAVGEGCLRLGVWIVIGIVVLAVGFGIVAALIATAPKPPKVAPETVVPVVEVATVQATNHTVTISAQGEVAAMRRTQVATEVGGKVIEVSPRFEAGELFEAGEVLVRIDPADYRSAHAGAVANLENARLALELEIANGERARRDWEKLGQGEPTPLVLRKPQLASAKAAVTSAEAAVEKALRDLERTEVRAPYPCRIERTYADLGATVAPGTPVLDIMSLGKVELRLPLSLEDYLYVRRNDDDGVVGEVSAQAVLGGVTKAWSGRLVRSEDFVESTTRTVSVVAEFGGESGEDAPAVGLFIDAGIAGRVLEDVVVLPRLAMSGPNQVMVVDGEDRLEFRAVEVVRTNEDTVVIGKGLSPGERVCITPLNAAVNGMRVEVEEPVEGEGV